MAVSRMAAERDMEACCLGEWVDDGGGQGGCKNKPCKFGDAQTLGHLASQHLDPYLGLKRENQRCLAPVIPSLVQRLLF